MSWRAGSSPSVMRCADRTALESLGVAGSAVAIPGGDETRQDALNCASVKVCEGFRCKAIILQPPGG